MNELNHATTRALLLPCVQESEIPERPRARLPDLGKRIPARRALPPKHRELVDIRKRLALSQAEFAKKLKIEVSRLTSYEYGRVENIPEWVMNGARAQLETSGVEIESVRAKFENLPMSEILANWAEALGISYDDNRALAAWLETSVATITRWKNALTRPSLRSLASCQALVEQSGQKSAGQNKIADIMPSKRKKQT